jgi:leucyl aminopeptidase
VTTELQPASGPAASADVDAVIVGLVQGESGPQLAAGADGIADAFDGRLLEQLGAVGATGKADEVTKIPTGGAIGAPLLVAVGLGKPDNGTVAGNRVRSASGAAARALAGTGSAHSTLGAIDVAAAAEGSVLGAYTFTEYRRSNGKTPLGRVDLDGDTAAIERAAAVAQAVATTRDLVNTPPNDLYPATFAERAAALAADAGVQVEILDEQALADGGYGGILGVGQGSSRPPRLVRLTWAGGDAPRAKVALVGKGITFDTGGISIKPAANMDHMTSDMAGAAAVIATAVLAARLNLPVAVTATVPMAENMPSGTSYRPGDVLRMYGGTTVEVLNTDAEGRLILGDAIARAAEDSPDLLVEVSTLTGAQQVALGMRTAGVMGTEELRDRIAALGRQVGEDAWAMPLPDHLREGLDSRVADLANVTGNRWGGMLAAGIFLREFVPDGLPWAHIDIAGPSFHSGGPYGYTTKGGTGVPVRTLAALLQELATES